MPIETDLPQEKRARPTFDDVVRARTAGIIQPVAQGLARLRIHPNTVTLLGFVLNVFGGLLAAAGFVRIAGLTTLIASSTDALDGALARLSGQQSRFGAFLDSTLDRLSEGALLLGMLWWFGTQGELITTVVVAATLLGSVMVSYARARAEGVGYECKVGLLTRAPRVFLLGFGMLVPELLQPVLAAMCALTWFTVAQRIYHVYRTAQREA